MFFDFLCLLAWVLLGFLVRVSVDILGLDSVLVKPYAQEFFKIVRKRLFYRGF
jgi:hypothetical protein